MAEDLIVYGVLHKHSGPGNMKHRRYDKLGKTNVPIFSGIMQQVMAVMHVLE